MMGGMYQYNESKENRGCDRCSELRQLLHGACVSYLQLKLARFDLSV